MTNLQRSIVQHNSAEVFYNLGIGFEDEGQYDEAIESFHSALHVEPEFVQARMRLVLALYTLNRRHEAEEQSLILRRYDRELAESLTHLIESSRPS